jgi:hypothetical protein
MTLPTLPPHEDDLRTFAAELRRATNCAEAAVHCAAHGEEIGPDLTAAVEAAFGALRGLGHAPKCATCGGSGRIANDLPCDHCDEGKRLMVVAVGKPVSEVRG